MKMKLSLRLQSTLLPILTGLLPIIVLWNNNLGQMKSKIVLLPLLFTLVYLLAVMAIWLLITRSLRKTALLSTMTSILTFSFGHLYNLLQNNSIFGISIGFVKLFVVYVILFLIFSFLIIRKINFPDFIFPLFNSILAVLIIFNLFSITSYEIRLSKSNKVEQVETKPISDVHSGSKPDIYYIVLDAYTRDDVLSEVIGYDNSAFLQALGPWVLYSTMCFFQLFSHNAHCTICIKL